MQSKAKTPEQYIDELPEDRKEAIKRLRNLINENLPAGFEEVMLYGMLGWVVPHTTYPDGYHVDPSIPLPFLSLASQKNHVALYHSGIYSDSKTHKWFIEEYTKRTNRKLDMGKSCVRFKNVAHIPYDLIGELCTRISPSEWIEIYETALNK